MSKIKQLIEKRDATYTQMSKSIIEKELSHLVTALSSVFSEENPSASEKIEWDDVDIVNNQLLILHGSINVFPGEIVVLDGGEEVVVNEEIAQYLTRVIKISLPLTLVETGDKADIEQFVRNQTRRVHKTSNDVKDEIERLAHGNGLVSTEPTLVDDIDGFDMNNLTEEQQKQLILFARHGKVNKKPD